MKFKRELKEVREKRVPGYLVFTFNKTYTQNTNKDESQFYDTALKLAKDCNNGEFETTAPLILSEPQPIDGSSEYSSFLIPCSTEIRRSFNVIGLDAHWNASMKYGLCINSFFLYQLYIQFRLPIKKDGAEGILDEVRNYMKLDCSEFSHVRESLKDILDHETHKFIPDVNDPDRVVGMYLTCYASNPARVEFRNAADCFYTPRYCVLSEKDTIPRENIEMIGR